jgi:DNA-directed RNA polymerase subunit RPC12/RpoP
MRRYAEFSDEDDEPESLVCPFCLLKTDVKSASIRGTYEYRCGQCGQTCQLDPDVIATMEEARG